MLHKSKSSQVIALALLVVLAVVLSACQKENAHPSVTTAAPTTIPTTTAAPDLFIGDDLMAIMDEAGEIFKTGSYVIENPNSFISHFFRDYDNKHLLRHAEITENSIMLSYNPENIYESKDALQFAIFLDLICTQYPDAFCDSDYTYTFATSRQRICSIFFAPDYESYGYSTPLDLYKAFEKNEAVAERNCFEIYYNSSLIIKIWSSYKGQNSSYIIYDGN